MKIVFYSSNTNFFDADLVHIKTLPSWKSQWEEVCKKFPEHEFYIVTQLPGTFLVDYQKNEITQSACGVTTIISKAKDAREFAEEICALNPDVAVAFSFWVSPYDWLVLNDAMIAEKLRERKIRAICHPPKTVACCFNKYETRVFLEKNNFNVPGAVYVQYQMYWAERRTSEVRLNVYRQHVLEEISKLHFPVVIKDTTGMSSYGIDVVKTFGEVRAFLNSKKFNSDRLIEEFMEGPQFGTEIHGNAETQKYEVYPPFMFSVNQYGITSPKQSVKLGPVTDEKFKISEMKAELLRLSKALSLDGIAQVDLVFSNNRWYVLEINPRLSGMTESLCVARRKSLYETMMDLVQGNPGKEINGCALDIKFPLLEKEQMEKLMTYGKVKFLSQTKNDAAKQRREMGFCEAIIYSENFSALEAQLDELNAGFSDIMENVFYENAKKMLREI